jgi:CHAT domain-containing protein/Tfp pilus assembly protein PilF
MFRAKPGIAFVVAVPTALLFAVLRAGRPAQISPVAGQAARDATRAERVRLFDAGKKALGDGDYASAEPLLTRGLHLAEAAGARAWQADFLNLLGLIAYHRGEAEQAMDYYRRALPLYQNYPSTDPGVLSGTRAAAASILNNMGSASDRLGRIGESLSYKLQALNLREQVGDKGKIADSNNALGIAYDHQLRYETALTYLSRALTAYEGLHDEQGVGYACTNIGNVYEEQGNLVGAVSMHRRSLDAATALDDKLGMADAMNNLANTYEELGQFDKALSMFEESLKLKRAHGDPQQVAATLQNIGNVQADKGVNDAAIASLTQALELRRNAGNLHEVADSLLSIGTVYETMGRLDDAVQRYDQARAIYEKAGDDAALASSYVDLANAAARQRRYDEAIALEGKAIVLRTKLASPRDQAMSRKNLGAFHEMRGLRDDYDLALKYYNLALPAVEATGNSQDIATVIDDIGTVYQHKADYAGALRYGERAVAMRRQIGNPLDTVISLTNLAEAYKHLNRLGEAERCFRDAERTFDDAGDQVTEPSQYGAFQQTIAHFYGRYAQLQVFTHRDADALVTVERGRARGMALQLAQNAAALETRLLPADMAKKRILELAVASTGSQLRRLQGGATPGDPTEAKAVQIRLRAAQRDYDVARAEYQAWRDDLYARNSDYRRLSGRTTPDISTLKSLSQRNQQTVYLEWQFVGDGDLLLFALSRGKLRTFQIWGHPRELEDRIDAWLDLVERSHTAGDSDTLRQSAEAKEAGSLYRLLFGSVEGAGLLKPARCSRIVAVGDGALLRVPFAALVMADGRRLVERYALSSALSLGSLAGKETAALEHPCLLCVADPLGEVAQAASPTRGELGRLVGARREGEAVKTVFPAAMVLFGSQAGAARVIRAMPGCDILHFATHGIIDSTHPLYSALILASDPHSGDAYAVLEARKVAAMRLSARLAVLSACDSASGTVRGGDGLIGLSWAFGAAGCPAVIATQWEINDTATVTLVRAFYRAIAAGSRKDDALRTGMLAVTADRLHRRPYYWAAFQLIGDAAPLVSRTGGPRHARLSRPAKRRDLRRPR